MKQEPMLIKADGNLVLMYATAERDRAIALFRVHMPASDELLFLVRLYSAKTEGGIHVPGERGTGGGGSVKTEIFDKPGPALKRCDEWLNPLVEVPEIVNPVEN